MNYDNVIVRKSKSFALKIIQLYKFMLSEHHEFVLSKQVLRSGTSIGANVREATRGQSKADFYSKMNIALKECSETEYWLELLHEIRYIDDETFRDIHNDCLEVLKILVSITKTQKNNP